MSLGFNCGQYEQAFDSKRLQNWEVRNSQRRRPLTKEGYTEFVANNRGHLLPSMPRATRSPWGSFVGTWDLPKKLPGNKQLDPTARSADAHFRHVSAKQEADEVIYGRYKLRRPKAGQPLNAMPAPCDVMPAQLDAPIRSGADNPLVKGTPKEVTPVKTTTPQIAYAQPPIDFAQVAEETTLKPMRVSPEFAARASPVRISPTNQPTSPLPQIPKSAGNRQSAMGARPVTPPRVPSVPAQGHQTPVV